MDGSVAVVGLGLIGSHMARRLIGAGFAVSGFDIDRDRCDELAGVGGTVAESPAEAVAGCWASILSLPDSDVVRKVCLGDDGISGASGLLVYDTTTGRPEDAVEVAAALAATGVTYCDATLSGNSAMAERGELVVMVGGPEPAYRRGAPLFEAIGRSHHHVGSIGSGARMKLLVNHLLTIHRLALAEVLVNAELAGLDLPTVLGVLKDSLAYSRAMDAWGERMVAGDHVRPASRLRQGHKDVRLILEQGEAVDAPLGLVEVVREALAEGEATGLGEYDNSAVMEVLRRRAGIGRV